MCAKCPSASMLGFLVESMMPPKAARRGVVFLHFSFTLMNGINKTQSAVCLKELGQASDLMPALT